MKGAPLARRGLHNLAMNIIGSTLHDKLQWESLLVNSELRHGPQFMCVDRNNQEYFVMIQAVPYEEDPQQYDVVFIEMVCEHTERHNARTLYTSVGLTNTQDESFPIYKDESYRLSFKGVIEIE